MFAECLEHMLHWCESCDCHARAIPYRSGAQGREFSKLKRRKFFTEMYGAKNCPRAGCRAVDFASGRWKRVLVRIFDRAMIDVDVGVSRDVSDEDKTTIVRDFGNIRQHVNLILSLKFISWDHLPLAAASIADDDQRLGRLQATRILALYDQCEHQAYLHRRAHKLCAAGGRLREQLTIFIQGADLVHDARLCKLRKYLAPYVLTSTCERDVEGKHAKLKRDIALAPHHNPSYVAFKSTVNHVEAKLIKNIGETEHMARAFDHARALHKCCQALGFEKHDVLVELAAGEEHLSLAAAAKSRCRVESVLLHCDRQTLSQSIIIGPDDDAPPPPPGGPPSPPPGPPPAAPPHPPAGAPPGPPPPPAGPPPPAPPGCGDGDGADDNLGLDDGPGPVGGGPAAAAAAAAHHDADPPAAPDGNGDGGGGGGGDVVPTVVLSDEPRQRRRIRIKTSERDLKRRVPYAKWGAASKAADAKLQPPVMLNGKKTNYILAELMLTYARPLLLRRLRDNPDGVFKICASGTNSIQQCFRPLKSILGSDVDVLRKSTPSPSDLKFEDDEGVTHGRNDHDSLVGTIFRQEGSDAYEVKQSTHVAQQFVFFTILHKSLPTWSHFMPHIHTSTLKHQLQKSTMSIVSHDFVSTSKESRTNTITEEAGTSLFGDISADTLFGSDAFGLPELMSLIRIPQAKELSYFMKGVSGWAPSTLGILPALLKSMRSANALPGSDCYSVHASTPRREQQLLALADLERRGRVICVHRDTELSSYRLTAEGVASMVVCQIIPRDGVHVLSVDKDTPLQEREQFELLQMLVRAGFSHEVRPKSKKEHLAQGLAEAVMLDVVLCSMSICSETVNRIIWKPPWQQDQL